MTQTRGEGEKDMTKVVVRTGTEKDFFARAKAAGIKAFCHLSE